MIKLSKGEWQEIFYALEYKQTSPAVIGDSPWSKQLKAIGKKIGPDGEGAARLGVSPTRASSSINESPVPLNDGCLLIGRNTEGDVAYALVVDDEGNQVDAWVPDEDFAARIMHLVIEGVESLKRQQVDS